MNIVDAIAAYIRDMTARGLATSTIENWHSRAKKIERATKAWEKTHDKRSPMKCSEMDGEWIAQIMLQVTGGAGNRNNLRGSVASFLAYCEDQEWVKQGTQRRLLASYKRVKYQRKPKIYVASEKFPDLLEAQERHQSDRAAMALLLYTLCRSSEVTALRWKHVDLETRMLKLWRQKTQRWTEVGICPELYVELMVWQSVYADELGCWDTGDLDPDWFVVPRIQPIKARGADGRIASSGEYEMDPTCSPSHLERVAKRGLDAIGVEATESGKVVDHMGEGCHTIRRSGARAMLKYLSPLQGQGDALTTVSAMLDHQDVKVTLSYIGMDQQKDELNAWLTTNSMYGHRAVAAKAYEVTP